VAGPSLGSGWSRILPVDPASGPRHGPESIGEEWVRVRILLGAGARSGGRRRPGRAGRTKA
jgi:hypothetical protein